MTESIEPDSVILNIDIGNDLMNEVRELHSLLLVGSADLLVGNRLALLGSDGESVGAIVALDGGEDLAGLGSGNLADESGLHACAWDAVELVGDDTCGVDLGIVELSDLCERLALGGGGDGIGLLVAADLACDGSGDIGHLGVALLLLARESSDYELIVEEEDFGDISDGSLVGPLDELTSVADGIDGLSVGTDGTSDTLDDIGRIDDSGERTGILDADGESVGLSVDLLLCTLAVL